MYTMKIAAVILAALATKQAYEKFSSVSVSAASQQQQCDKLSFKCGKELYLCGITDSEYLYGGIYPQDRSVSGYVLEGSSATCKNLMAAVTSSQDLDVTCPNGESITYYYNYCSGSKCDRAPPAAISKDSDSAFQCTGGQAGVGGDPHFRTYDGTQYSYHGNCDLVLVHSDEYDLDIHIRTENQGSSNDGWSLVSNVAVRMGEDVFEMDKSGSHLVNGKPLPLPVFLDQDNIVTQRITTFTNNKGEQVKSQLVMVKINAREHIKISLVKGILFVRVNAYIPDARGMLGSHSIAGLVGRNNKTLMDGDRMAQEWQVRPEDTTQSLFQEARYPQFPQTCTSSSSGVNSSRRMRAASAIQKKQAETACAKVNDISKFFCIQDVILTDDVGIADAYRYAGF